jgi:hypothetical protein
MQIMSVKLNVGVSRKVGLPDYGSVGATCNVEVELDGSLLKGDLEAFYAQVRHAYGAARQAVHDELARLQAADTQSPTKPPARDAVNGSGPGDGHARGNGEAVLAGRTAAEAPRSGKPATASQVKAIRSIARQQEPRSGMQRRQNQESRKPGIGWPFGPSWFPGFLIVRVLVVAASPLNDFESHSFRG